MNKEKKILPELSFPKFKNDGEWKEVPLIGVTDKNVKWSFTGGPFGSNLKSSDYVVEENGIRIIQLQNIGDGEFKNDYKIFTSKEKADELLSCNIYPGDIIMSKMGDPVGRACLIPDFHDRYVMGSDGIRIVVDENKYDKYFIYLIINSKIFRSKVESSATGSTRKRIGLIDLKKLTLFVPKNKVEQQKIANCLSSLDNLVTAETEKLDHLKDHKKGLLQQLFPAKGETKPQFRFPEFESDGDWEEKTIDELGNTISGLRGKKGDDFGSGEPYVTYKQVFGSSYVKFEDCGKVKVSKSENQNTLIKGDILFTTSSETPYEVGFASVLVINPKKMTYLNSFCFALRPNNTKELLPNFSRYLFHSKVYRETVTLIAQGSTRFNLSKGAFIQLKLRIPNSKEQHKIAVCLSSVDDLIAVQTTKIEALKSHKKGLMQQLFPNSI